MGFVSRERLHETARCEHARKLETRVTFLVVHSVQRLLRERTCDDGRVARISDNCIVFRILARIRPNGK